MNNRPILWQVKDLGCGTLSSDRYVALTQGDKGVILFIIIIITNEKIKVMLSRKRCRGTLHYYNKGEISKCQSKLWTNRNVFSWYRNGTREETVRSDGGRLFHARGAATGKARSPRVDLCTGGTTSVVVVDDRR